MAFHSLSNVSGLRPDTAHAFDGCEWKGKMRLFKRKRGYTPAFFAGQSGGSHKSAEIVADIILSRIQPATVIDVGCGVGTWARAFKDRGCNVIGLDGDYVRREDLYITPDEFRAVDLSKCTAGDFDGFDLAVCLEVAEHIDPTAEKNFLDFLSGLAPYVLFSAALPGQGGVGHVNEQWQSHWIDEFHSRGMSCLDVVRPKVWGDPAVKPWYAQNAFLFSRTDKDEMAMPADVIHPGTFMRAHKNPSVVRESLTTKVPPP